MDNNKIPYEKNMRYENLDNNKVEYNAITNNYSINFNINNNKESNETNNGNNLISKEKIFNFKTDKKSKTDKNQYNSNLNINTFSSRMGKSPSSGAFNNQLIDNDRDSYINKLKEKLSKTRAERRKKEEEAVTIQHRLTLLKNKEQTKIFQFKKMKGHINKILNNRNKVQENLKIKLKERNNYKNRLNAKFGNNNHVSENKNKKYLNKPKNNTINRSQKNIHPLKLCSFDSEKKSDKIDINIDNFNIDDDNLNINKNNDYNSKNNFRLFKEKLIKKIKQDEEEKKRIEKEIAKIEVEENKLLKIFNKK